MRLNDHPDPHVMADHGDTPCSIEFRSLVQGREVANGDGQSGLVDMGIIPVKRPADVPVSTDPGLVSVMKVGRVPGERPCLDTRSG